MARQIMLYDENIKLLENHSTTPVHIEEVFRNVYIQLYARKDGEKSINVPLALMFVLMSGVFAFAGLNAILEAVDFMANLVSFDLIQLGRGIGVSAIGLFCLFIAFLAAKAMINLRKFVSTEDVGRVVSQLLGDFDISIGQVIDVSQGRYKTITIKYVNKTSTLNIKFETCSNSSIEPGDTLFVLYNSEFYIVI